MFAGNADYLYPWLPLTLTLTGRLRSAPIERSVFCMRSYTNRLKFLLAGVFAASLPAVVGAQANAVTPEAAIRGLVRAIYSNDAAAFARLTLPDPRLHLLTRGGSVNEDGLRELNEDPSGVQIIPRRSYQLKGAEAKPDSRGEYPTGTSVVFMVAHHRGPMVVVLEKRDDGWKVDPRWWLAAMEMSEEAAPDISTPEFSIRSLFIAMLSLDRSTALGMTTDGTSPELLFMGAPSQREPSGHLEALVFEMPIVELKAGEFRSLYGGEIVEGGKSNDTKLLVGLMGSVEVPIVVQKVGSGWRVKPQPFFYYLNR